MIFSNQIKQSTKNVGVPPGCRKKNMEYNLTRTISETTMIGDHVSLEDGVYMNADDEMAIVVIGGRFMGELEIFREYEDE